MNITSELNIIKENGTMEDLLKLIHAYQDSVTVTSNTTDRVSRIYDVTVYNRQNEVVDVYSQVSAQYAGKLRNEARRSGNHVHQIEISSLSGEVKPVEFTPPTTHYSEVDKSTIPMPTKHSRDNRESAKFQQEFFAKANAELKKANDVKNLHTLVYEKITSKLCFSGDFEDAARFILNKMKRGEWDETSWVLYMNNKLFNRITK